LSGRAKLFHFFGDDREAFACLARSSRFDGRVQSQKFCLSGNCPRSSLQSCQSPLNSAGEPSSFSDASFERLTAVVVISEELSALWAIDEKVLLIPKEPSATEARFVCPSTTAADIVGHVLRKLRSRA